MSLYSVVVPVYNSEHTLEELYTRLKQVFETEIKEEFELILVDDSSRDGSYEVMEKLHETDRRVKIIQMARNFGQHPALLCGFHYAKGDFIITMDDDLQHRPEELPKMIQVMNERDDVDVILARYENRKHNLIRKIGTRVSIFATSKMLHKDPNLEITSFRLMRRFIVEAILNTDTHLPQIGNLLVQTSNRIINVPVHHDARKFGKSNYTFRHLVSDLIYDISADCGQGYWNCKFYYQYHSGNCLSGALSGFWSVSGRLDHSGSSYPGLQWADSFRYRNSGTVSDACSG